MVVINFKFVSFALAVLIVSSCRKVEEIGNKLTADELAYLRERATKQCITDSDGAYLEYERSTNTNMLNFERGQTWKYEEKTNDTVTNTNFIYVWKVAAPNVYFRFKLKEGSIFRNRFIKIDTSANVDMIRAIQKLQCAKTYDSVSNTNYSVSISDTGELTRQDAETRVQTTSRYSFSTTFPSYFGFLQNVIEDKTYDNNDVAKATTKKEYTISSNANTTLPASYTDSVEIPNREFCVPTYTAPASGSSYNTYAFPYQLTCLTADNGDVTVNGTIEFEPDQEL